MCHFCPAEIKSLGLGAGSYGWAGRIFLGLQLFLFFCFTCWQQYIGKKDTYGFCKTMYNENMRKKHNCIWGPASWYFPVKNKKNPKQISTWSTLWTGKAMHSKKTFLKTFKLCKTQTLVKCKLLRTKHRRIWMPQASLSTSNATEQVSPMAVIAEVLLDCLQN